MSRLDELKAAAAMLSAEDQVELFKWWVQSEGFRARHLEALKREVNSGIDDLEQGRYQTFSAENIMQLAEDVGHSGREKIQNAPKPPK